VLSNLLKRAGGIAPAREAPAFASRTFVEWFRARDERNLGKPKVLLWPDTFNNYFTPERAVATVEVLEAAGYRVIIPSATLCCGRPLYDFGMLRTAKRLLKQVLDEVREEIADGAPLIGIEPSCVAVFRDELRNLFPEDEDAKRLAKQTFFLSEFLVQEADYQPPQLSRKAIVHGHCHHRTILRFSDEETLLRRMGLDLEVLDSGCCGMAGSFGFEAEKYDVSIACAERELFPAVRAASPDTLVITDGFSCHEQLVQGIGRRPMHIAEVLQLALHEKGGVARGDYPPPDAFRTQRSNGKTPVIVAGAAAAAAVGWWLFKRRARRR
jgi:Fe-S oxidoreductase